MIHIALKESAKSDCRAKHGAAICRHKNVLSKGHNSYKCHPKWSYTKVHSKDHTILYTIHAEADAIRQAIRRGIDIRGTTIFVARNDNNGGARMSKPCVNCQKLIERYGIAKIVYTDENGEIIEEWPPS
jgi:deoxycytidylate deaminase